VLILSLVLALLPLIGVAAIVRGGLLFTVDGLFMALILLTIAGVFGINALMELRDRGLLPLGPKAAAGTGAQVAPAGAPSAMRSAPTAPSGAAGPAAAPLGTVLTETGVVENIQFFQALVGEPNRSLVTFRAEGGRTRIIVFCGNVGDQLPRNKKVQITYAVGQPCSDLLSWEVQRPSFRELLARRPAPS